LKRILLGLAFFVAPIVAQAHPHVWVDTDTTFVIKDGTVVGLKVGWKFDEFFSSSLLADYDKDHNKHFDAQEIAQIEQKAFNNTALQNYFTFVKVDGVLLKDLKARDFTASVDPKGIVRYQFSLPFPTPIDPKLATVSVTYYEDTYYVDIAPGEKDSVHVDSDGSLSCTGSVAPDMTTTIYYGTIHPNSVILHC
jgi:ABC-type uncharacterized transport system substrate-binding protein